MRALLAHHEQASGFLEPGGAMARELAIAAAAAISPAAGEAIGAWRIVRLLGQGGMGAVYLVERNQGGFRQQGALKLIRSGLVTDEMVQRFLRERQILASLEHPNIAHLLDGGTAPREMPYLVMEYVDGEPLYEYCTTRGLSVDERLELFVRVCEAVSHAHRRLVLHRDFKPGNLLVTREGVPKLLDFGISKVFDEARAGSTLAPHTQHSPMTPEYASPEQLREGEVTTATDVYALGVLLYELLTGARPFPPSRNALEHARMVEEHDPERPSTAVTAAPAPASASDPAGRLRLPDPPGGGPQALRRRLAGDLDNIVLKAMHRDPERRYASVDAFVEDLRRYRDGLPVAARSDAWSYRAAKFVRRHRAAVGAVTVALLALIAALAISLWQGSVARHQRGLAERRYRQVHSLANTLLFEIQDSLATRPATLPVRELMISRAQASLDSLAAEAHGDTTLLLDLVDAYHRLAWVQGLPGTANLGKVDEARANLLHAQRLAEELLRARPRDPRMLRAMVRILTGLGTLDSGSQHADRALATLQRALEYNQRLLDAAPADSQLVHEMAVRKYNLGDALCKAGKGREGRALIHEAIADLDSFLVVRPDADLARRHLLHFVTFYGDHHTSSGGSRDTAKIAFDRASRMCAALLAKAPGDVWLRYKEATIHSKQATLAWLTFDDPRSALHHAEIADSAMVTLVATDPGNHDLVFGHWISTFQVAYMAAAAGQPDRAEPAIRREVAKWYARLPDPRYADAAMAEIQCGYDALSYVDEARALADDAAGRPSLAHWRSARRNLARMRVMFDSLRATGDQGTGLDEHRAIQLRRLARIDSALLARPATSSAARGR